MAIPIQRLQSYFFQIDTVELAQKLLGKVLVRCFDDGTVMRYRIAETEAYCGAQDLACHSAKGRTARTEIMFHAGGLIYVYLIYGMYWMLNIVSGKEGEGTAVLIRGIKDYSGPGRVGRALKLDKSFYGEELATSERLWLEDAPETTNFTCSPRVGINYAGEPWISKPWRFVLKS